jgi:hypothetical protein
VGEEDLAGGDRRLQIASAMPGRLRKEGELEADILQRRRARR